jgi:hypothetical protein
VQSKQPSTEKVQVTFKKKSPALDPMSKKESPALDPVNEVDTPPDIVDTPDKACRPFKL